MNEKNGVLISQHTIMFNQIIFNYYVRALQLSKEPQCFL